MRFTYEQDDPIFMLNKPNPEQNPQQTCLPCGTPFGKKDEQTICQFCGRGCCKNCTQKSRPFPLAPKDPSGMRLRGPCCKLCDRKFLLRNLMDKTQKMMEVQNMSITAIAGSKQ